MSTWLVAGGAGYIGSHVTRLLKRSGQRVVVLDDLSTGVADRVGDVPLVVGDYGDGPLLRQIFARHEVQGVIHLAAAKAVEESVADPLAYYRRNVVGMVSLLESMAAGGVERIVYSSSAAVYGETTSDSVSEDSPTAPTNPYGETKLIGEWLIQDQARARGLRFAALRYFNVAGTESPDLVDTTATNLVPIVLGCIEQGRRPRIFGADYPTADGTCVRDFVHVVDLARAHVAVLDLLDAPGAAHIYNVGCGKGYSVREVIQVAAAVAAVDVTGAVVDRRAGDPAQVVADTTRITTETKWRPERGLQDMIKSTWEARRRLTPGPIGSGQ